MPAALLALLVLICLFGSVASAAAAAPGKPTAKAPKGTITTTKPTFKWSKARGAAKYELRVYKGSKMLLKKSRLSKRSWKSSKALPTNVGLSWKVRARNARGPGAWSKSLKFKVVTSPNTAKAITAFSFQGLSPPVTGTITEADHTIALTVPFGTDVGALVASFTTTGAAVAVAGSPQVSGTTANDFSSPVTYTVTAVDHSTQAYVVTVKVAPSPSPAKAITAFSFQGLSPPVTGTITEADHTIALTVPFGTDVSALVASFTTTGAAVKVGSAIQTSGTTANDFTHPVTYTVTAADTSTQAYTVTVTVASGSAKAITAFSFQGLSPPVTGVITEADHTIALTVPFGTDVSALVASFTTTGAAVKVGSAVQTSGTTANDFSGPVTYTVTAADTSTQAYTVTVTVAAAVIGQSYGGGVIAYVYQSGDPGYVAGETHGLISSIGDQSSMGIQWSIGSTYIATGATGVALGTGAANTTAIIAAQGAPAISYAAGLARAYNGGGHNDWYLPSKDELRKLYLSKDAIGGSWSALNYWSSSELSPVSAWLQNFANGHQSTDVKQDLQGVHAVRSF